MDKNNSWDTEQFVEDDESNWLDEDLSVETESIDLSDMIQALEEEASTERLQQFHTTAFGKLLEALPIPAFLIDGDGWIALANQAGKRISSNPEEVSENQFHVLFQRSKTAERFRALFEEVVQTGNTQVAEGLLSTERGNIWGRLHMRSVKIGDQRGVLLLVEDLTPQKRQLLLKRKQEEILEQGVKARTAELERINKLLKKEIRNRRMTEAKLRLSSKIIKSSNEAIMITDLQGNIVDVNPAFTQMTGYSRGEVLGKNPRIMKSDRHPPDFFRNMWQKLIENGQWHGEVWDRRKSGELFAKLLSLSTVRNGFGRPEFYVGIFSDITKIKETEQRLERLAHYDPLTSLPNRVLFRDRLKQALIRSERTGMSTAVMFLDLDRFKNINDTMGHPAGDELLVEAARRLQACVRRSDTVARIGGDEFILVLSDFADVRSLAFLGRKIISQLSAPFALGEREVFITCSIGIAVYPTDGQDVDGLLQNADTAMYHAKERGKGRFQFFSEDMNVRAIDRLELETSLRVALQNDEFVLHYQPQIDLTTGRISGAEALIRWKRPHSDPVFPDRFIPLAEETGLINEIGDWVLSEACRQMLNWQRMGMDGIRVAVNMSGRQLKDTDVVESVHRVLEESGLNPDLLELEITESTLMHERDEAVNVLHRLKDMGVGISIDDFGTGYSSLSYLKRLPIDRLKIDRSFIKDVTSDLDDEAIVKAVMAVAHSLNLKVVAEGVETQEILEFLKYHHCDEAQGYLFSRPVPPEQFAHMLWKDRNSNPGD